MTGVATNRTLARVSDAPSSTLRASVLRGLRAGVKTISPALFYDAEGARLFEEICCLPEYYPTRTEHAILARHAAELATHAGAGCALIEYGSGAGVKVRFLLDRLERPVAYVPVDISREQLLDVSRERARQYPGLRILPVHADYTAAFELPTLPPGARRVAFFPGSTIGNFHPAEAAAFLRRVRHVVGREGGLILGVDRRKDPRLLHAAYNDSAGVTAAFNRNLLTRLNREFGGEFNVDNFRHRAFFDDAASRIEMHLEALVAHEVCMDGEVIRFALGETIHTECSYKFDRPRLEALAESSGFRIEALYSDERDWFWEAWLVPA
ncbi:MAG: L-histidine N(alpha)-methyltransferase [Gemmatimonadetes bacterium]|nr:L-histidine N(alpha)-methyltransferase [Gemmatimonadota bacterium]